LTLQAATDELVLEIKLADFVGNAANEQLKIDNMRGTDRTNDGLLHLGVNFRALF